MKLPRGKSEKRGRGYLDGQMLIAMPAMLDERFVRSLIYICAHSSEGAMGIVVNHPAPNISFPDLLVKLECGPAGRPHPIADARGRCEGHAWRPGRDRARFRSAQRRFLHREFHAADRRGNLPHRHDRHSQGDRPRRRACQRDPGARLCRLGARASSKTRFRATAGCIARPIPELVFGPDIGGKYDKALKKIGIDLGMLSSEAGHA